IQNINQVLLYQWVKNNGAKVEKEDIICIVQSGQELLEVKSPVSGILMQTLIFSNCIFDVTEPIAIIADETPNLSEHIKISKQEDKSMNPHAKGFDPSLGPVVPIVMPQAGQSMEEGLILSWKVKEGDRIEVGQIIMEIETDKATMEVEAVDAGYIAKIVAQEGDIVEVKMPVAYLAEPDIDMDAYLASVGTVSPETSPPAAGASVDSVSKTMDFTTQKATPPVSPSGHIKASPAARKAARQAGFDLAALGAGSGPDGRILSTDLENAKVVPSGTRVHTVSKMRRAIAANLLYAKQNIPHYYATATIDAGLLFTSYRRMKEQFTCSVNDFITCACARAIRKYPVFRSQYKDSEIVEYPSVNIGIAVGSEDGLMVPVLLHADRMNLEQLAARTREIVEAARNGKLEGTGQGTFTITNLGMFGVEEFSAIINPPESAILAVGTIREGVVVENQIIRPTRLMTLTLSADHRIIDGLLAGQFLQTLKELLENPEQLIA
ncbi:MAG: 2-oxo acid dehydrogenase subunit E2, partial [Sedimentisphaerales bacterium]|nr:2-oxo acid dehydrogenase subunit E2 [Sedimentisphaerales bacterium]